MDLNIDNYSVDELLNVFNINGKNSDIKELEKCLSKSISLILSQENNELPEDKNVLIDFYSKAAFKILNDKTIVNNNSLKKNEIIETVIENEGIINNNFIDEQQNITQRELINGGVRQPIPPIYTINTNRNKFSEGVVDPLERETITSLLSINSKFRDSYSKSSTDFNLDLNEPLTNVVSIKLASIEILNSYYTISEYLRTNRFNVKFFKYDTNPPNDISQNSIFDVSFVLPDGNYHVHSLVSTLNEIFQNNNPIPAGIPYYRLIKSVYDESKGKIIFLLNDASGNPAGTGYSWGFDLNFRDIVQPNRPAFLNLGWILGFRQHEYFFFPEPALEPEDCCDVSFNKSYYDFKYKNNCKGNYYNYRKNSTCNKEYNNQKYKSACSNGYSPHYQDASTNVLNIGFNPEAVANLIGTHYFLLEVDDFNKNQAAVFRSNTEIKQNNIETFSYNVSNVLARIPNTADSFSILFEDSSDKVFKTRKYFGPVRISKLKIRLLDENGVVVNLNNNDIIINLQIESLNAPYKNLTYRK